MENLDEIPFFLIQIITKVHLIENSGSTTKLSKSSVKPSTYRYYYNYEIARTLQKYLDHPQQRCINQAPYPNMTACIAEYIAAEIGCSMNFRGILPVHKGPCNTTAHLDTFAKVSGKVESQGAIAGSHTRFSAICGL